MAEGFLATLKRYLQGLVADLRAYCITDVSSTMERTRWGPPAWPPGPACAAAHAQRGRRP